MRILFFDLDCVRPDHLGCYGYPRPTSPAIDSVARQGMRFHRYYCASSPCLPSRTAWSSGRFSIRNGVLSNHGAGARFHLRTRSYVGPQPDNEILMRRLRAGGFHTVAFSNFADRHNAMWFHYGWSEYHTPNLKGGDETAEEVNAVLLPWLRHNAARDNLFLYINYWDAHRCYKMDASWAERFKGSPVPNPWPDEHAIQIHQALKGPFTARGQFANDVSPFPLMPGAVTSREDFEHMVTGYDAAIAYVDHHIAQVLEEFECQDALDRTAVIISGDHGDAFGEHGIYSDHVCADECIHHIPLIIRWPGVAPEGSENHSLLYNIDFAPTLCELLDLPTPGDWDGTSFHQQVTGQPGPERDHLIWDHGLYALQRAVRTRTHLMIRTYDPLVYAFEPVELYNLVDDPHQTRNLRDDEPEILAQCSLLLENWIHEQRGRPHAIPDPLDEILRERAKS